MLHEGNANHPANLVTSVVFRDVLGSDARNQVFEEFIDEDRLGASDENLQETLRRKYTTRKIDLVIGDGRPAFRFLAERVDKLWPGALKIFYFLDRRELPASLPPNMTGVAMNLDFGALVDLALKLEPNTRNIYYVGGVNEWEQSWRALAEQDFRRFNSQINIFYLNDLSFTDLLERLGHLPSNSAVIYPELLRDAGGHVHVPGRVCSVIASASNAPVYGPFDGYIGCGIVGGAIVDLREVAQQTANLALRVLDRRTTVGFPIEGTTNHVVLDWRQLQKWEISEKNIPPDSIVQFRPLSLWEQQKPLLISGLAFIFTESALIAFLILEMQRRKKADSAVKHLNGRLITACEDERKRLARELHDDIGQRLSLISVDLDVMQHTLCLKGVTQIANLRESVEQLGEVITDVHNLSHQLHSSKLQALGLEVALREVCRQMSRQHNIKIDLTTDRIPLTLPEEVGLCFYRVAQEALNNSLKHSGGTRVEVKLRFCDGLLTMAIKDDGGGFDPSGTGKGLGLATMRERIRIIEGEFLVNSKPGKGTEIIAQASLRLPLRAAMAA